MYIMRKMNREKKAATDAERAALLADGYRDVTPPALHEDIPAETEVPVKMGKASVGKNRDKAQEPIKKPKAADTRQKKTVAASGSSDQGMAETEKAQILENTELSESAQKESVEGADVPEAPHSEVTADSAQEQSPAAS